MRFKKTSLLSIALILALIFTCMPFESAFASISQVDSPALTTTFSSTDSSFGEYCKGTVEGSLLKIKLRTLLPASEFRIALYGTNPKTEVIDLGIYVPAVYSGLSSTGKSTYGFDYTLNFADLSVPDGAYFLYISRRSSLFDKYETAPSGGALYKNLPIIVSGGMPFIPRYDDIIKENDYIQQYDGFAPSEYLDTSLEDVRFLFVDPITKKRQEVTPDMESYFRQLSNKITAGVYNDYDKLLKIYEYVAGNFYYDTIAFSSKVGQYANPYRNLYNHENLIASENSDSQGRVATTCQGFAGMFVALARAQGIPARLAAGHRATSPNYNWDTEANITARDHWWAEAYVNGRWIFVDPTVGTNNRWNRNTDKWTYYGVTNYTYFDPSDEQISVSHIYLYIYRNLYMGSEVSNSTEISKLTSFFANYSQGMTNGKRLNNAYTPYNKRTWGDGVINNFYGDGAGRISRIKWVNYGLTGAADFSGFTKLKYLYLNDNQLTSLNVKNDSALLKVDVSNNNMDTVDLTGCKSLTSVLTAGNQLKTVKIYANKRNTTISSGDNGYIYITYTKSNRYKLRTFFVPDIGYKLKGFYNDISGRKLTSGKSYSMNPIASSYSAVFVPDPNSFKYLLKIYQNYGEYADYNEAAQKRLTELGYSCGYIDGYFDYEVKAAVERFQTDFLLPVTGEIDELTWSILFSPNPAPLVPEPEDVTPEDVTPEDGNNTI